MPLRAGSEPSLPNAGPTIVAASWMDSYEQVVMDAAGESGFATMLMMADPESTGSWNETCPIEEAESRTRRVMLLAPTTKTAGDAAVQLDVASTGICDWKPESEWANI